MRNTMLMLAASLFVASPALAQDPYDKPDDTWVTLSGTVTEVAPDAFGLAYGDGAVTVEMDDWDNDADAFALLTGDRVTVTGKVDDDFFEATTVEASSVYVEKLNTYFYASAADEEGGYVAITTPITPASITVQGTVTAVEGEDFVVDSGLREIRVATDGLAYDPLDDEGFQQIDVGDRVSVTGTADYEFFDGRELLADVIVTLENHVSMQR